MSGAPPNDVIAEKVFEDIVHVGRVNEDHLKELHTLFDKHFDKAVEIVDQGGVHSFTGRVTKRRVFQVQGHRPADRYTVIPRRYCSCHSFHFDVIGKGEAVFCKHQLAVQLSEALRRTADKKVNDLFVAEILAGS